MKLDWQRLGVVIPPSGEDDWKRDRTANPDLVFIPGEGWRLYYNGGNSRQAVCWKTSKGVYEISSNTIGVALLSCVNEEGWPVWEDYPGNPILPVGEERPFDLAIDPAVAFFAGRYFLSVSAWKETSPGFIGLASSEDGLSFVPFGKIFPGRAPELVIKDDQIFLFYVMDEEETYVIHLATGKDWDSLEEHSESPVLRPLSGTWEATAVTTPRIYPEEGWYYMVYAGDPAQRDYPPYFGLARSRDLVHWKRWEGNPFFERGPVGEPDEGAIWYGELLRWKDGYLLYYEGYSEGPDRDQYGGGVSQICAAYIELPSLASLF